MVKSLLFRANSYLRHYLHAVDEHSLHTPYLYKLYTEVLKPRHPCPNPLFDSLYTAALRDQSHIEVEDHGAGSQKTPGTTRSIADITRHSSSPRRFARLLARLADDMQAMHVLELGSSLGFTSMHLRGSHPGRRLITFEGAPAIAARAKAHFEAAGCADIDLRIGPLHYELSRYLEQSTPIDLVYMDAHHTAEATMRYFSWLEPYLHENSIVVIDDIYWSEDMHDGWKRLCNHERVVVSADLFEAGFLFFNPGLQRQHLLLSY